MKAFLFTFTILPFSASAQTVAIQKADNAALVQHTAQVVAHLHDEMLDPASFVLDSVFVTKPNKRGKISVGYEYRAHNAMSGYAEGRAVEDGDDRNRLSTYAHGDNGHFQGYDVGWIAPCKAKNIEREITSEVKAAAPERMYHKER